MTTQKTNHSQQDSDKIDTVSTVKLLSNLKHLTDKNIQEIKHFFVIKDKELRYLCNQATNVTKTKLTNDYFDVTCKNCKEILNQDRIKIERQKERTETLAEVEKMLKDELKLPESLIKKCNDKHFEDVLYARIKVLQDCLNKLGEMKK